MPSALSLPRISTNVRFAASAFLSPDLAGAWAERLFLTPPRPKDAALTSLDLIDAKSGQLLTGSLMDYALPRADDLPSFKVGTQVTPCTHNPLGAKGCGEAGAIGAPAALMNAVMDALSAVGVKHFDMPASPHRVWSAIQAAQHAH